MLSKKIEIVKELLPEELAMLEITEIAQCSEEYYNKFTEMGINSQIGIKVLYEDTALQINFFQGIGYKHDEVKSKVVVTVPKENIGLIDNGFYYWNSDEDNVCQKLWNQIKQFCYGGIDDNNEEVDGLFQEDCEFIYNAVKELEKAEFIIVDEKIHRDLSKRRHQIQTIQTLVDAVSEISCSFLYQVHVVYENRLTVLEQHLTKEKALERYLHLANYWYKCESTFVTEEDVLNYVNSEECLDNDYNVNVVMEVM